MRRLFALSGIAIALLAGASFAAAQSSPPPMQAPTSDQSATVNQRVDAYRAETARRVARGEITQNEADNLLDWREWQIARQVAATAPSPASRNDVPPVYTGEAAPGHSRGDASADVHAPPSPRRDYVVVAPPPYAGLYYYSHYPAPYYGAPYPYFGPSICAAGFGHHFAGRICF